MHHTFQLTEITDAKSKILFYSVEQRKVLQGLCKIIHVSIHRSNHALRYLYSRLLLLFKVHC